MKTVVELKLLTDPDMLLMFEKGIRGGFVQAMHRYAKANSKYMGGKYNPKEQRSYLQYLDPNNLYGWAMTQDLPVEGFNWVKNVERFTSDEISRLVDKDKKGYVLEVDVKYPEKFHNEHNDLPFMCEEKKINKSKN